VPIKPLEQLKLTDCRDQNSPNSAGVHSHCKRALAHDTSPQKYITNIGGSGGESYGAAMLGDNSFAILATAIDHRK